MGGLVGNLAGGALSSGAGAAGTLVGLSIGGAKSSSSSVMPTNAQNNMAQTLPKAPALPTTAGADASATQNAQMEAERERERQAALLRKQQAPEVFTSGLGAAGLAETSKKSLLGG